MSQANDAATPSKLTGTKLLLIVLGIVTGSAIALVGAIALTAALGWKLFQAVR